MNNISALTLNYRDPDRTTTCVRNLLVEGAHHVLVWDNSDDGGLSVLALTQRFINEARVSVVDAKANLGFSAGVNRGLEWLHEKYPTHVVVLLNNDASLEPGALHALQQALCSVPGALVAFPDIDHGGWIRGKVYYHRLTGLISDAALPGSFLYASGCCLAFAPHVCSSKVFDEDFFMYGEDWALGWRLAQQHPGSLLHVPRLLVRHEGSASSKMGSPFYESRVVAAHLIIARKLSRSTIDGLLVKFLHGTWLAVRAFVRSIRRGSMVPLGALLEGRRIATLTRP